MKFKLIIILLSVICLFFIITGISDKGIRDTFVNFLENYHDLVIAQSVKKIRVNNYHFNELNFAITDNTVLNSLLLSLNRYGSYHFKEKGIYDISLELEFLLLNQKTYTLQLIKNMDEQIIFGLFKNGGKTFSFSIEEKNDILRQIIDLIPELKQNIKIWQRDE